MSHIVKYAADVLGQYGAGMWSYADPRTAHLPMVRNPLPTFAIVGAYLYFVLSLGPRLMQHRKPFNLDRVMLVYNAVQVVWCGYLVRECLRLVWGVKYSWTCEPVSKYPEDYEMAFAVWLYYILKIVDLLDTVFMVLRKNFHQISFLHVYHHAGMVVSIWVGVKVIPGGHHTFLGLVNCVIHCFLYGYYLVALLEPRAKAAWWKKYITIAQLVQFAMIAVHELVPFLLPDCDLDRRFCGLLLVQSCFMCALFGDFYYKAYIRKQPVNEKRKET